MNKISYLPALVALLTTLLSYNTATPQTCRVSLGTTIDGVMAYMEVYEYDFVSKKPEFPGGDAKLMEYINHERKYPREAYKAKIQGRVTCSFIVNADGSVSHVTVLKSVEPSLNREAVRIFSGMPAWHPGRVDGTAVPVRVIRSVAFRI